MPEPTLAETVRDFCQSKPTASRAEIQLFLLCEEARRTPIRDKDGIEETPAYVISKTLARLQQVIAPQHADFQGN
jgi:hypothetical protein